MGKKFILKHKRLNCYYAGITSRKNLEFTSKKSEAKSVSNMFDFDKFKETTPLLRDDYDVLEV